MGGGWGFSEVDVGYGVLPPTFPFGWTRPFAKGGVGTAFQHLPETRFPRLLGDASANGRVRLQRPLPNGSARRPFGRHGPLDSSRGTAIAVPIIRYHLLTISDDYCYT